MPPARISVLMTSHRRCRTLSTLAGLAGQCGLPENAAVRTHLVDAGSTDSTPEAVCEAQPEVDVTTVGTDVYWKGTKACASRAAVAGAPAIWPETTRCRSKTT